VWRRHRDRGAGFVILAVYLGMTAAAPAPTPMLCGVVLALAYSAACWGFVPSTSTRVDLHGRYRQHVPGFACAVIS